MATLSQIYKKERPPLILCNPTGKPIESLSQAYNMELSLKYSSISELSFDYFFKGKVHGKDNIYNNLVNKMVITLEGVSSFIIEESSKTFTGDGEVKHVVARSIESEMLYKRITAVNGAFKFFDPIYPDNTIIGRILKIMPGWAVGDIDPELMDIYRTFDIGDSTVYNFLTDTVAKAYSCLFVFGKLQKTISAYLIKNVEKPTDLLFTFDNVNMESNFSEFDDEMVTALDCYGGGELDIRRVNPLGGNIIYDFGHYISGQNKDWMSENLRTAIMSWENKVKSKEPDYKAHSILLGNLIEEYIKSEQLVTELRSSLEALSLRLEGLLAEPTEQMNEESLQKHEEDINTTKRNIENTKISIRLARREKATIRKNVENKKADLRKINFELKFTAEEVWEQVLSWLSKLWNNINHYRNEWRNVYFETSDELELDISHLGEVSSEINEYFSRLTPIYKDLLENANDKKIRCWQLTEKDIDSISLKLKRVADSLQEIHTALNSTISNTDIVIDIYSDIQALYSYREIIGLYSNFSKEEYINLQRFIFHNTYTNENIIITDIMDELQIHEQSEELYKQAKEVLKRVSRPRYEFSGNFLSVLNIPEFRHVMEGLELGGQITIELTGGEHLEEATLLEVQYNYEEPTSFKMVFGNRVKLSNSNYSFAELFLGTGSGGGVSGITSGQGSKSGAITSSESLTGTNILNVSNAMISKLGYISFGSPPPQVYGNNPGAFIGYKDGAKLSLYSSSTDYLQWDGKKLLVKARNFTLDSQGNITATNATLSGRISATTGSIGGWEIGESSLFSDRFRIDSAKPSISMGDATDITMGTGVWIGKDSNVGYGFRVGNASGLPGTDLFMWDETNGITTRGDWLSGWVIEKDYLYSGDGTNRVQLSSSGSIPSISAGSENASTAPFRVYRDGRLFASNANISGEINATLGKIGGWVIETNKLRNTTNTIGLVSSGNDAFYAGSSVPSEAPFYVDKDGKLKTTDADISGKITASEGRIGNWVISNVGLKNTNNNVGMISTGTDAFFAGGLVPSEAPFYVSTTGFLKASNANIEGVIKASEGFIGGWAILPAELRSKTGTVGLISEGDIAFYAGQSVPNQAPFYVTKEGFLKATNAELSGSITATIGEIGGWIIANDRLKNTDGTVGMVSSGNDAFFAGGTTPSTSPFYVSKLGKLKATDAEIAGEITATSGNIAGWNISNTKLSKGDVSISSDNTQPAFKAGASFSVSHTGVLNASDATISGTITANSGKIGGWNIRTNALDSGTGTSHVSFSSAGGTTVPAIKIGGESNTTAPFRVMPNGNMYSTSGEIAGWTISSTALSKSGVGMSSSGTNAFYAGSKFSVTHTGTLKATDAEITGMITATDGLIGGWGIFSDKLVSEGFSINGSVPSLAMGDLVPSGYETGVGLWQGKDTDGKYKWRIGNPLSAGGMMGWDGTSLSIRNSALEFSGGNSYIAFGDTPPTSSSAGTGIWIDKTGFYGLNNNVRQIFIDTVAGKFHAGDITLDQYGLNTGNQLVINRKLMPGVLVKLDFWRKTEEGGDASIIWDGAKIWTNKAFRPDSLIMSTKTVSATEPANTVAGMVWIDTSSN